MALPLWEGKEQKESNLPLLRAMSQALLEKDKTREKFLGKTSDVNSCWTHSKGKRLSMCKASGICEAVSRSKQLEELQRFTVQKLRTACFG